MGDVCAGGIKKPGDLTIAGRGAYWCMLVDRVAGLPQSGNRVTARLPLAPTPQRYKKARRIATPGCD